MSTLTTTRILKEAAITFMCAGVGVCALLVGTTVLQFRSTAQNLSAAAAQLATTTVQLETRINKEMDKSLPLVNANLIHSDLVLSDLQRVTDLQEGYWNTFSDQVSSSLTTKRSRARARTRPPS